MSNLKQWALRQGIHPVTAYRWHKEGKLPITVKKVGRLVLVDLPSIDPPQTACVYARVSSSDQSRDLPAQVARTTEWATQHGILVGRIVTEIGSGLNGKRKKLLSVLADPSIGTIVVEHRDRLARWGADYIEAALRANGRKVAVVDPSEIEDDLVRDMTDLLTSMCAKLYGRRAAKNRAKRALEAMKA